MFSSSFQIIHRTHPRSIGDDDEKAGPVGGNTITLNDYVKEHVPDCDYYEFFELFMLLLLSNLILTHLSLSTLLLFVDCFLFVNGNDAQVSTFT